MTNLSDFSNAELLPRGKVTYASARGVALITLTHPPVNGYSYDMLRDLDEAILRARMEDSVGAIVIAGAGEKFFCAGADIAMLHGVTQSFKYAFCLHANETLQRLERTPKLVIAALGGHTVGGGLEIALACDLRLARRGSGKCGLPEVSLGVLPGTGGTQRLVRIVGRSRAIELMASGRLFDFDEARALGIVDEVRDAHSESEFVGGVIEYAASFCAPSRAQQSVGAIKLAVQRGADVDLDTALALERELQARLFASDDAREGIGAFVAKRPPKFTGS